MASSNTIMAVMILRLLLMAEAIPRCRNYDNGRIFCTAGAVGYDLQEGFLSGDADTKKITLRECRITGLKENSLKDLPKLEYLDLSGNRLSTIEEYYFNGLNNLIHLNLSYNMITKMTAPLTFAMASNIETLDLRGNQVKTFQKEILTYLKNLKYIDLSYNLLTSQKLVGIFENNGAIRFMDLTGNQMETIPVDFFTWAQSLEDLRLDACSLNEVPNLRMNNLETIKYLSLSSNNIKSISNIDTFIYLLKLETINLAENEIDFIADRVFLLSTHLKTIILRKNKLKMIPEGLFHMLPNLSDLDLSNNLLEYLPVDAFRSTAVKSLNLAGNRFTYLSQKFLSELKSIHVSIEQFYFHQNPWQCSCFLDILGEVKMLKIKYDSDVYNGKRPVCVKGEEFKCKREPNVNQIYGQLYDKEVSASAYL